MPAPKVKKNSLSVCIQCGHAPRHTDKNIRSMRCVQCDRKKYAKWLFKGRFIDPRNSLKTIE